MTKELVEEVARVLCKHRHPESDPSAVIRDGLIAWQLFESDATALLPILARQREEGRTEGRNEGIEAAAEVAESYVGDDQVCTEIATAIRALKEPE